MKIIKGRRGVITATISQAGAAFDLTDYEAVLSMAQKAGVTPALSIEGVISAPVTGVVTFTILPDDTATLAATDYKGEVNIYKTDDSTTVYTPVEFIGELRDGIVADPVPVIPEEPIP
jgi:hypothetical protein